jgi:hypothetical protein
MQQFHLIQCVSVVVAAVPITIASFFSDLIGKISRVQELVRRLCLERSRMIALGKSLAMFGLCDRLLCYSVQIPCRFAHVCRTFDITYQ